MEAKYYLIFLVLLLSINFDNEVFAQKCLVMNYDLDGNRISRTVIPNCRESRDLEEVQEVVADEDLCVYPNPNYGSFKIIMPDCIKQETAYYELYDINGVLVKNAKLYGNETEIDIGNTSAGIYLLKIINGEDVMSKIVFKL